MEELGNHADAAEAFAKALKLAPNDPSGPEIALARARSLESANRADDALAGYAMAAEKYPGTQSGYVAALARARLLAKLGKNADAAAAFERLVADRGGKEALAKAGATADGLLAEWGWSLVDASRSADADRVFSRLLKEYPESPYSADARFNLAESANLAHQFDDVVRLLSPLAARKPVKSGLWRGTRRLARISTSRPTGCFRPSCIDWGGLRSNYRTGPELRRHSTGS